MLTEKIGKILGRFLISSNNLRRKKMGKILDRALLFEQTFFEAMLSSSRSDEEKLTEAKIDDSKQSKKSGGHTLKKMRWTHTANKAKKWCTHTEKSGGLTLQKSCGETLHTK
jgi:hypothetical protein